MEDDRKFVWARYVAAITGGLGPQAIAKIIKTEAGLGPSQPTVGRWLHAEHLPKPAEAAVLARTFNANVLGAFVAADFITATEADAGLSSSDMALLESVGVSGVYGT